MYSTGPSSSKRIPDPVKERFDSPRHWPDHSDLDPKAIKVHELPQGRAYYGISDGQEVAFDRHGSLLQTENIHPIPDEHRLDKGDLLPYDVELPHAVTYRQNVDATTQSLFEHPSIRLTVVSAPEDVYGWKENMGLIWASNPVILSRDRQPSEATRRLASATIDTPGSPLVDGYRTVSDRDRELSNWEALRYGNIEDLIASSEQQSMIPVGDDHYPYAVMEYLTPPDSIITISAKEHTMDRLDGVVWD